MMNPQWNANPLDAMELIVSQRLKAQASPVRRFLGQSLLAALVGFACTLPVAASTLLQALVEPASQEHHIGKVIFVELVTPDLGAAKKFYGGLFGWRFRDMESGKTKYVEVSLAGRPVAGLIHKEVPAGEQRQPAWLTFIANPDVDAAKTVVLAQGGKVLSGPQSIPNRGRQAVFTDPQGAVFAVLTSSSGDPPDLLAQPGEWIWSSLITTDPDTDAAFYQTLFDYEVFDLPDDGGSQHLLFASDNYARASANTLPENRPNVHPHWLNYVHVEDAVAMATKVVALGGRVLVEPRVDRHGGRVAVVADPLGARFGLLEWPDDETKGVAK
jgi:predicted enzyme related to lactoylglutathione lyase